MDAIPVWLGHPHLCWPWQVFFIAMIRIADGGIIVANESTMVSFGDVTSPTFLVGLISIVATVILYSMNIKGSILIGIIIAVLCGIPLGVTQMPWASSLPLTFPPLGHPSWRTQRVPLPS